MIASLLRRPSAATKDQDKTEMAKIVSYDGIPVVFWPHMGDNMLRTAY